MKKKIRNAVYSVSLLLVFSIIGTQDLAAQNYLETSEATAVLTTALETGKNQQLSLQQNSVEFIAAEFQLQSYAIVLEHIEDGLSVEEAINMGVQLLEEDSKNYGTVIKDNSQNHDFGDDYNSLISLLTH